MRRAPKPRSAFARAPPFATGSSRRLRGIANRCMQFVRRAAEAVPPLVAVPVLIGLQLLAAAALGPGPGWPRSTGTVLVAACLLAAEVALVYAVMHLVAGRLPALFAGLGLVAGPVILAKRYFQSGGGTPPTDYRIVYRHDVLPTAFGLVHRAGLLAACLLLASAWLVLVRTRLPVWATASLGGAAAAAAALVFPHAWLAGAAPVAATLVPRAARAVGATLVTAALGIVVLAVLREVPHVAFGWHQMGQSLDNVREFSWSRRLLEYLPLAGVVGLARRSGPAAAFFAVVLVAAVILPLSRPLGLTDYLLVIVPGIPAYWLLTASIPFLVPRPRAAAGRAGAPQLTTRQ